MDLVTVSVASSGVRVAFVHVLSLISSFVLISETFLAWRAISISTLLDGCYGVLIQHVGSCGRPSPAHPDVSTGFTKLSLFIKK